MKKSITLVLGLLLLLPVGIFAGDFSTLNFIGFSRDGKYLAFEEYGSEDGSGFPYSNYFFVNAANNTFAAKSVNVRIDNENATEQSARSRARLLAAQSLRKLGIVQNNTGDLLVSRMLTDLDTKAQTETGNLKSVNINFARMVGSMYMAGDYTLTLTPSEANSKKCEAYGETVYKMDLTLKDNKSGNTQILQKDNSLPDGRGCPLYYGVQSVYWYKDKLAVFVQVYTMGFEGPDMRFMTVTGNVAAPSN